MSVSTAKSGKTSLPSPAPQNQILNSHPSNRVPARLNIQALELRNFMSFGDYVTRLELNALGPVLIVGENVSGPPDGKEDEDPDRDSSNGAGKTSLLTAFVWCLFGRTSTMPKPGDKVVNWYTKKDCYVKIETTDGWSILRTRNADGHDELLVEQSGVDKTQSTNTNAQKFIDQQFGLDFDIFSSSVFCGQMAKSFLEAAPVKRKEALERILGLDKLNILAEVVKEEITKAENEQAAIAGKVDALGTDMKAKADQIDQHEAERIGFETERDSETASLNNRLVQIKVERDKIRLPNLAKLQQQWALVDQVKERLDELEAEATDLEAQGRERQRDIHHWQEHIARLRSEPAINAVDLDKVEADHANADKAQAEYDTVAAEVSGAQLSVGQLTFQAGTLKKQIDEWEAKAGTTCSECGQEISANHVAGQCVPQKTELAQKDRAIKAAKAQSAKLEKKLAAIKIGRPSISLAEVGRARLQAAAAAAGIKKTEKQIVDATKAIAAGIASRATILKQIQDATSTLERAKPKVTLEAAEAVISQHKSLDREAQRTQKAITELQGKKNPYSHIIKNLANELEAARAEQLRLEEERRTLDILFTHYKYIHRSYSDRRQIKKWLLDDLIPFLNQRIHYYLDSFGIDLQLSFTSTLGDEMDKWDYELCSGGERKRIDLAIMFGLYDLYLAIYGPQCNVMILDEVDGKLDGQGVRAFTEIVLNDLAAASEKPKPDTILVVSHKTEMKAAFPAQIVIRKEEGFSSIISVSA